MPVEVIVPPDYEDFTSSNRGLSKSNSGRQHPPVYEDDYLQPRSKANGRRKQNSHQYINVELPGSIFSTVLHWIIFVFVVTSD